MSRSGTLSTLGLYEYDKTLFDLMVIPAELDKDVLVDNLLSETAELEILYANANVLKNLIGIWSNKQIGIWRHLYETTQYEYNPIENYDRNETGSTTGIGTSTHSGADTDTITSTDGGTETARTADTGSDTTAGERTTLNKIAGFNSAALVDQSQTEEDTSGTITYGKIETETTTFGKTNTTTDQKTYGHVITDANEGGHTLRAHGNIGVTTTQEMIKEEREIALFNMYDIIIQDYIHRFCVMVY